jgi:hypothetical protein
VTDVPTVRDLVRSREPLKDEEPTPETVKLPVRLRLSNLVPDEEAILRRG